MTAGESRWDERWHPLRGEWVIIAAHRQERPWLGQTLAPPAPKPAFDPNCYFCPGNVRVSGIRNDNYSGIFVFDNDHPCVGAAAPRALEKPRGIYRNRPASGLARIVCYSPKHNLSLAELSTTEITALLETWRAQYAELGALAEIQHVLVFENRGEAVGVSNPHPHCQIYATNFVFKTIETEAAIADAHLRDTGRVLFQDILKAEREDGRRIVFENASAIVFVPYFARYAYECYVAPKATHSGLATLSAAELRDLAEALKALLVRYDKLWQMDFPYVMTLHHAPINSGARGFHFHFEFHPPLRKPHLLKYLAGPEIGGGNFLSDTLPEEKAAELRQAQ